MNVVLVVAASLFGLIVGSFLNVIIYRLEKEESPFQGRSYCPSCKHSLAWHDLIPLFSFLSLRGRCRYCKQPISWHYPFVELLTAVLFLSFFIWAKDNPLQIAPLLFIGASLIVLFAYDLKHYIIPDKVLYPALGAVFLYQLLGNEGQFFWTFFSAAGASAFFFGIHILSRGKGMGFADGKLAFLLGMFLGWPRILLAVAFSFWAGAFIGLMLIALQKKTLQSQVPFGPFLIGSALVVFFFSEELLQFFSALIY